MRLGALGKSRADRLVRRQVDRQKAFKVAELAEESARKAAEAAQATAYMAEMQQWHHWQQLQAQAWHWQAYTYEGQGHQSTGLLFYQCFSFFPGATASSSTGDGPGLFARSLVVVLFFYFVSLACQEDPGPSQGPNHQRTGRATTLNTDRRG